MNTADIPFPCTRRPLSDWSRMLRALDVPDRVRQALACVIWWEWFARETRAPGDNKLIDDLLFTGEMLRGRRIAASAADATDEELYAGLVALRVDRQWAHRRIFGAKRGN